MLSEINIAMGSRRDFLKKALLLAAGGGFVGALPASIQKAFAIDPQQQQKFFQC
jgi:phospholipase C